MLLFMGDKSIFECRAVFGRQPTSFYLILQKEVTGMIPVAKMSKKARKEYNKSRRTFWDVKPVTRYVPNKKKNHIPEGENERGDS